MVPLIKGLLEEAGPKHLIYLLIHFREAGAKARIKLLIREEHQWVLIKIMNSERSPKIGNENFRSKNTITYWDARRILKYLKYLSEHEFRNRRDQRKMKKN